MLKRHSYLLQDSFNPIALRKAKSAYSLAFLSAVGFSNSWVLQLLCFQGGEATLPLSFLPFFSMGVNCISEECAHLGTNFFKSKSLFGRVSSSRKAKVFSLYKMVEKKHRAIPITLS